MKVIAHGFAQTKHGIMPVEQAKSLESFEKSQQTARTEAARERLARAAFAAGVSEATFSRIWANAEDLLKQRLRKIAKLASKPRHELEREFPCLSCKVAFDDAYKAACSEKRIPACYMRTAGGVLKGCPDLKPRIVVSGYAAPAVNPPA